MADIKMMLPGAVAEPIPIRKASLLLHRRTREAAPKFVILVTRHEASEVVEMRDGDSLSSASAETVPGVPTRSNEEGMAPAQAVKQSWDTSSSCSTVITPAPLEVRSQVGAPRA